MSPPTRATDSSLGSLAHYQLQAKLGEGAMGTVYRARNTRTGGLVAIKVIHPHLQHHAEFVRRFQREGAIAAALTSPYAVRVYESRQVDGRLFLAMEYVDGGRLSDRLARGPLPLAAALRIASHVARALDDASAHKVVHRDVKPDNILLTRDGGARLADFGIARLLDDIGLSRAGQFIGTLPYAAPEQFHGQVDTRLDIYALGVTLFQMLTGELPFQAASATALMRLHQEAPPPLERLAGQPAAVVAIVARCLAKRPEERFQHPRELHQALMRVRQADSQPAAPREPARAHPLGGLFSTRAGVLAADQRTRLVLLLGGLTLTVLVVTLTLVLIYAAAR